MKTFEPGFFDLDNFIKKQETFDFLPTGGKEPWYPSWKTIWDSPWYPSWKTIWDSPWYPSWKTIWDSPWYSICSPMDTVGTMPKRSGPWQRNGTAGASFMSWIWNLSRISM